MFHVYTYLLRFLQTLKDSTLFNKPEIDHFLKVILMICQTNFMLFSMHFYSLLNTIKPYQVYFAWVSLCLQAQLSALFPRQHHETRSNRRLKPSICKSCMKSEAIFAYDWRTKLKAMQKYTTLKTRHTSITPFYTENSRVWIQFLHGILCLAIKA